MTITTEEAEAKCQELLDHCHGQPAKVQWPHRVLHDAVATIRTLTAERDTAVNAARLAAQIGYEWKDRAERAEAARDEAISQLSGISRELGEAEGKLAASEMAGVVEGWKARAERAEAEREFLTAKVAQLEGSAEGTLTVLEKWKARAEAAEAEAERLREALKPFASVCQSIDQENKGARHQNTNLVHPMTDSECDLPYPVPDYYDLFLGWRYLDPSPASQMICLQMSQFRTARAALEGGKDADRE